MLHELQCSNCKLIFTEDKHLNTHKAKVYSNFCHDIDLIQKKYLNNTPLPTYKNITSLQNIYKSRLDHEDSLSLEVSKHDEKERQKQRLLEQLKYLEQQQGKLVELTKYKRPLEQPRELIQYNNKDVYRSNVSQLDDFSINHGKKMAELKLRREGLEKMNQDFSKKIEEGKTKTGYGVETLPLNSYTFKDIKESSVSSVSDGRKQKLDADVIQNRKNNLKKLQEQYKKIGGDDPSFYNSIAKLQKKYNIQAQKALVEHERALQEIAKQPPKSQNDWMLPFPSREILPEGSFSNYQPMLIGQTLSKQQTIQQRVVASIMAQQYQSLQMLSKIPKDSQLYKVKLQQYKQLSKYREQALKEAHLQRLRKLKNQFQMERKLDIKELNNDKWVNNVRKNIINKVKKTGPGSDKMNCGVFLHMVKGMPKSVFQIRANFKVIQNAMILLQDDALGQREAKYSVTDGKSTSTFNQMINLTIEDKHSLSILIEVSCNSIGGKDFRKLGWSLIKLTNSRSKVIENNYKLPLFQYPLNYNIYLNRGASKKVVPQILTYLKVFEQQPNQFLDYVEPRYQKEQVYLDDEVDNTGQQDMFMPQKKGNNYDKTVRKDNVGARNILQSGNRGYVITFMNLKTDQNPQNLILETALYIEEDVMYSENNQPLRSQFEVNDHGQKHGNIKSIRLNEQMKVNLDIQKFYNQIQRQIYLMILLRDKTMDEDADVLGWYCYKITNFNKIRQGDAIVRLVRDDMQIPFDMNLATDHTQDQIHFRMDWFYLQNPSRQSRRSKVSSGR